MDISSSKNGKGFVNSSVDMKAKGDRLLELREEGMTNSIPSKNIKRTE